MFILKRYTLYSLSSELDANLYKSKVNKQKGVLQFSSEFYSEHTSMQDKVSARSTSYTLLSWGNKANTQYCSFVCLFAGLFVHTNNTPVFLNLLPIQSDSIEVLWTLTLLNILLIVVKTII